MDFLTGKKFAAFFRSRKLAVVLILLIIVFSIIGTHIPQESQLKSDVYNVWKTNHPNEAYYFEILGLTGLFSSPIFISLAALLFVNTLFCTRIMFNTAYRRLRNPQIQQKQYILGLKNNVELRTEKEQKFVVSVINSVLKTGGYRITQQKFEKIRIAGFVVLPVSFLIMGAGSTYSKDLQLVPASLRSYWLIAHAGFATIAFGALLVAVGIATLYILKDHFENINKDSQDADSFYKRLPSLDVMDEMMYGFVAFGLIDLTIMIGTGAIWANQTWGRYWGWDPIETWSLISWFTYATCLHLRVNMGWNGKRIAWLIIFSIFVLAFSLYGVGYVYGGLHADYLTT